MRRSECLRGLDRTHSGPHRPAFASRTVGRTHLIQRQRIVRQITRGGVDADNDGGISYEEALAVTSLDLSASAGGDKISDLSGLEHFTRLEILKLKNNDLRSLAPVEQLTLLTLLDASDNRISGVDLSQLTLLNDLDLSNNELTSLDLEANTALKRLAAQGGAFASIEIKHLQQLETALLDDGALESLVTTGMDRLRRLEVARNSLLTLTANNCPALEQIDASGNRIVDITLFNTPALAELDLSDNNLLTLDVHQLSGLRTLIVSGNNVTRDDGTGYLSTIDLTGCALLERFEASSTTLETVSFAANPALRQLTIEQAAHLTRINLKNEAFPDGAAYRISEGNALLETVLTDEGGELEYVRGLFSSRPEVTVTSDDSPGPGPVTGFVPQPAPTDGPDDEDQNPDSFGYFMTFPNVNLFGGTLDDAKSEEAKQECPLDESKTATVDGYTAYTFLVNGNIVIYRTYYLDADGLIQKIIQYVSRPKVLVLKDHEFIMNPNFPVNGYPALTEEEPADGYYYYSCSSNGSRVGIRAVVIEGEELGELVYTKK